MNSAILEISSVIVHGSMIGSHCWQKAVGKIAVFFVSQSRSRVRSVSIEHHSVEYGHSCAAGYLKIGWRTNVAMHSMDKSRSSGEYYYRLYWVHALIRHYLTTGRKYALIKKYAPNKHVRLLTRLYGILVCFLFGSHHYFTLQSSAFALQAT